MNYFKRFLVLCLTLALCMSILPNVFAANTDPALIDPDIPGSIEIYKYDFTSATEDGIWDSSYVSTGVYDKEGVNDILGDESKVNELGNGDVSYGYAIKGVEFTYLYLANVVTRSFTYQENHQIDNKVLMLYGFDRSAEKTTDFLSILGLSSADRFPAADDGTLEFYTSDVLIGAMNQALNTKAIETKKALEQYMQKYNGTAMPETDSYGHTSATELPQGLYLITETKVPEMVTKTVNPFLVSIPMTTVNGTNATDGGERWLYDVVLYPKNGSSNPTLEKTVRESAADTGKNNASNAIDDGYAHTATGSAGDVMQYQIISKLPSITSSASYLKTYTFKDTLSKGITYNKEDVVLEFFTDADCTEKVATWTQTNTPAKFTVAYASGENSSSIMTISMTEAGLQEINTSKAVYSGNPASDGYSDCYLRITYAATVNSDATVVYGDNGNPNTVTLTWQRTSSSYFDTLQDDCHVYVYGIDLLKQFSDGKGNFKNVAFLVYNRTDGYYIQAKLDENDGTYYVIAPDTADHSCTEANATRFVPTSKGKILIKGLEDDEYTITEVKTDNGYTLLADSITVLLRLVEGSTCNICNKVLYSAEAFVDGKPVNMKEENGSVNALVVLSVINTKGFDLPNTGDHGTWMFGVGGAILLLGATTLLLLACRKKSKSKS